MPFQAQRRDGEDAVLSMLTGKRFPEDTRILVQLRQRLWFDNLTISQG